MLNMSLTGKAGMNIFTYSCDRLLREREREKKRYIYRERGVGANNHTQLKELHRHWL